MLGAGDGGKRRAVFVVRRPDHLWWPHAREWAVGATFGAGPPGASERARVVIVTGDHEKLCGRSSAPTTVKDHGARWHGKEPPAGVALEIMAFLPTGLTCCSSASVVSSESYLMTRTLLSAACCACHDAQAPPHIAPHIAPHIIDCVRAACHRGAEHTCLCSSVSAVGAAEVSRGTHVGEVAFGADLLVNEHEAGCGVHGWFSWW